MRSPQLRRQPDEVEERRPQAAVAPPLPQQVLQLQRGHGNAAVTRMIQRQAVPAAPAGPAAAPAAPAAAPAKPSYEELLKKVKDDLAAYKAADKKGERAAQTTHEASVRALTVMLREELPPKSLLDTYLDRPDIDQKEKVQTIGQLAAEVARMEFLLGTLHNLGTKAKWEKNNKGAFTDDYQKAMGGSATAPWCTKFAGYAYDRLGFQAGEKNDTSIFHSGYRLRTWANKGKDVSEKKQITEKDKTVASGAGGSAIVDDKAWAKLKKELGDLKKPKKKAKKGDKPAEPEVERTAKDVVADFFKTNPKPQSGDIIVKPRGSQADNKFSGGSSHTMMVDQFDDTNFVVYTVEGNTGDKVASHKLDLTDEKTVGGIIFMTRLGTEYFGDKSTTMTEPPDFFTGLFASRGVILGAMQFVNAELVSINHTAGFIQSKDAKATVHEWIHGDKDAEGGADTET